MNVRVRSQFWGSLAPSSEELRTPVTNSRADVEYRPPTEQFNFRWSACRHTVSTRCDSAYQIRR